MKRLLAIASSVTIVLTAHAALAAGVVYEGRCLNPAEGDMDRCRITVNDEANTLSVHFKSEGNAVSDLMLQRNQIIGVSGGDFERRRGFAASFFLGAQPQDRVQFMVEYTDAQGNPQSTRIDVERKTSRYLESDLEDLIGQRLSAQ